MATRRTTMRSRSGTKLYAVRDKGGKFTDIQRYSKAHAADLKRTAKAEVESAKDKLAAMEKRVERAAKKAVRTAKARIEEVRDNPKVVSMQRKVNRTAKKAAKTVRASLTDAMAAVKNAARKMAKQVKSAPAAAKKAARKTPAKRAAKSA